MKSKMKQNYEIKYQISSKPFRFKKEYEIFLGTQAILGASTYLIL